MFVKVSIICYSCKAAKKSCEALSNFIEFNRPLQRGLGQRDKMAAIEVAVALKEVVQQNFLQIH